MSKDISIVFKSQDQLSQSVIQMKEKVKEFGKDIADYKRIQDEAFGKKAELQLDMRKAKEELKEMSKLVREGAEGSNEAFIAKQKEINQMSEGMKRYNQVISEANKAERDLNTTRSRNSNNPNSFNNSTPKEPNVGKQLVQAGMLKDLGNSMGNYMGATLTSMYGDRLGNQIGGAISSTLSGALMGASVGGPLGAAIGGAVGLGTGAINALAEDKRDRDSYFKGEVKNVYDQVTQLSKAGLDNGTQLGKQRENDIIAFKTLLGGKNKADKFLNDTEKFASVTPFTQPELLGLGKGMMTYGYKQDEIIPNLKKLGDAFAALGVDGEGKKASVTALGRMKSSGKTSLENINILQDKGIDAVGILAEKMETSKAKVYEMISKGAINGADTARVITEAVGKKYKGAMEEFSKTTAGLESTLEDMRDKGDRAEGEGFNKERKKGLEAEIAFLEKMKVEDRKYIGEYKASLKNKEEQLMRDKVKDVKENNNEYKEAVAKKDGAKAGQILAEAQTQAIIEWNNGPEMKKVHEAELARVKATQEYIGKNGGYVDFGRKMAEQFNLGWDSTIKLNLPKNESAPTNGRANTPKPINKPDVFSGRMPAFATGTNRIPYDDYPALLHEGEKVLTSDEVRQQDNNKPSDRPNINININRAKETDEELASLIVSKINNALFTSA